MSCLIISHIIRIHPINPGEDSIFFFKKERVQFQKMTTAGSKRRKGKDGVAAMRPRARLTRVRRGKTTKKKASSGPPGEAAAARQPVYLVVEHGVEEPTHSILEVAAAGPALRPPVVVIVRYLL